MKVYEVAIHARLLIEAGSAEDAARKADDVLADIGGGVLETKSGRPTRRREYESSDAAD